MADPFRNPAEREQARIERRLRYGRVTNLRPDVVVGRADQGQFFAGDDHIAERYLAEIEAPPDFLTDDGLDVFDHYRPTATPEGVSGFLAVCALEGADGVSREAVLAEIDLRSPGWPGDWTEPRRIGPAADVT